MLLQNIPTRGRYFTLIKEQWKMEDEQKNGFFEWKKSFFFLSHKIQANYRESMPTFQMCGHKLNWQLKFFMLLLGAPSQIRPRSCSTWAQKRYKTSVGDQTLWKSFHEPQNSHSTSVLNCTETFISKVSFFLQSVFMKNLHLRCKKKTVPVQYFDWRRHSIFSAEHLNY